MLAEKRQALGLNASEVAQRAALKDSTYWRIETGKIASPRVEFVLSIAKVLNISCSDMFASFGWIPPHELPTLRTYLRTKYPQLSPEALMEINAYLASLGEHYGVSFDTDEYGEPSAGGQTIQ